jgi:hypothetical protein
MRQLKNIVACLFCQPVPGRTAHKAATRTAKT